MNLTLQMPPTGIERRVYNYLFQMAEQLNLVVNALDTGNFTEETKGEIRAAEQLRSVALPQQYQNLKSLVIKTADVVRAEMDTLSASLTGTYVAQSDFGTYVKNLSSYLEANPEAITQYYKFASELQADLSRVDTEFARYKTETGGYIRTGIVDYDGETPVYGVAVGQNLTTTEVDGQTVVDKVNFRSTFTANRLSFWQDDTEVAYVSNNQLYIGEVTILRKLTVGSWIISADSGLSIKWGG